MNSLQDVYCSTCKFVLATQGTTPLQREKLTYNIIESALARIRSLLETSYPKTRKQARNKVGRSKEWGQKDGYPWIETVEDRWDYDEMFRETMEEKT